MTYASLSGVLVGDPPAGQVVEISNTSELLPGDFIYIEFPWSSLGWLKYGASEAFKVLGVDPSTGKVSVVDESGNQNAFDGGTKQQLIAKLQDKTSFSTLQVIRQPQAAPAVPVVPLTSSEQELVDGAALLGLPGGYDLVRADRATTMADLLTDDYVYSVNPVDPAKKRLWRVIDTTEPDKIRLSLVATTAQGDLEGEQITVQKTDIIQRSFQMPFREAPKGQPPITSPNWCPAGQGGSCAGPESREGTALIVGGAAGAAILALYLLFG